LGINEPNSLTALGRVNRLGCSLNSSARPYYYLNNLILIKKKLLVLALGRSCYDLITRSDKFIMMGRAYYSQESSGFIYLQDIYIYLYYINYIKGLNDNI